MADRSVRLAWADDAPAIAGVQARAFRQSYADLLPDAVLADIDADTFAQAWKQAIAKPPSARHRVLVALERNTVVGFAATAPSDDPDAEPSDGEVVALHVDPDATGVGHGSRLISAVADTLRADGFAHARVWVIAGDDAIRRFLEPAGWAADGAHRQLDLTGDATTTLRQVRLQTDLRQAAPSSQ
jgi:ribosomal protein S18 acetylase RimI-like enzyme